MCLALGVWLYKLWHMYKVWYYTSRKKDMVCDYLGKSLVYAIKYENKVKDCVSVFVYVCVCLCCVGMYVGCAW